MSKQDPENSPLVRHVLYTNDVGRILHAFVASLFTIARPERVKVALERLLKNWDSTVATTRQFYDAAARSKGETSGWDDS